ncbi:MAG: hypothetical protein N2745_09610 [Syntrophorhabdaceae bacterium]|nr:hypothetical protein [Syntrophorhabdaceae bacterium]
MTEKEKALIEAGWEKRFIACEPRLSEMVELYREIGFEVHLEPLPSEGELEGSICCDETCTACYDLDRARYRIIYTRKAS